MNMTSAVNRSSDEAPATDGSPEKIDALIVALKTLWKRYGHMLDTAAGAKRYELKVRRHYIREYISDLKAGRVPTRFDEGGDDVEALLEPLVRREL
jgi:hypothetical protein